MLPSKRRGRTGDRGDAGGRQDVTINAGSDLNTDAAWPDTAGDLPFAMQRPRAHPVVPPRPDEARLLRSYAENPASASVDEAIAVVGGEVVSNPLYDRVLTTL